MNEEMDLLELGQHKYLIKKVIFWNNLGPLKVLVQVHNGALIIQL